MPWFALFLAAALLWPPGTRRWALAPLAVAWAWALADGVVDPVALAWPALLIAAAALVRAGAGPASRAAGHALFVVVAVLLFAHLLPGFHNLRVIAPAPLTPDAVPFGMYLNMDKPLVGFWVVLVLAPQMAAAHARLTLQAALLACAGAVTACLGLALALGVVGWAPKWPASGWIWLLNNALLVTLAEEALFRGYVQERLTQWWRHHPWGAWAALAVAAALFGLAHYAGGWQWMLLAALAGVGYGVAYRYGGLAAAVLAHLGLNAAHFGWFTYPMRAAL
ncbi:CPBP family intramembrane glutamic endopeptidase [Achromobacter mucicolens]|uniref:CPBP family intramembrane glutamic endopeptidase n=1 Tax=Achromobacter mucicolens TaxID=1389922 RepID=UPI00244804AF|nr:CPBP family intramembrane metalloprotease [Achromobacter mucicolens]MDH1522649.1 CPBP family intramembrane metalloprotease [Achromobacter mucicolens]